MLYEESEIRKAWADYFEELATPVNIIMLIMIKIIN